MPSDQHPTILITGGTGFVGSHLVEHLLAQNPDQRQTIHTTDYSGQETLVHSLLPTTNIHQVDLTQAESCFELIADIKPDHIYHLAALSAVGDSFKNTASVLNNNMQLQLNLLEAVAKHAPQARVLIIGSAMEYDFSTLQNQPASETSPLGPLSPYAVSKTMQDLLGYSYARSYGLKIIRVRPFNHIGERQSPAFAIPAFAQQIAKIEAGLLTEMQVGNLAAVRDFTDVRDVVRAYELLINEGEVGAVYNVGSGTGYSMQEILEQLIKLASTSINVTIDQNRLRPADIPVAIADPTKINHLGWEPTIPITNTLKRILTYWRGEI